MPSDRPWGAEDMVLNTNFTLPERSGNVAVRRVQLDAEEMTAVERHKQSNTIIYVADGAIDLRVGEDFFELETGEGHYIEAGTPHQIENLDASVTDVVRISMPYDPDDVEVLEDPYE